MSSEDSLSKDWDEPKEQQRSMRRTSKRISRHNLRSPKSSRVTTPREKTLRRLESNERERMRMHSLNDAFQVNINLSHTFFFPVQKIFIIGEKKKLNNVPIELMEVVKSIDVFLLDHEPLLDQRNLLKILRNSCRLFISLGPRDSEWISGDNSNNFEEKTFHVMRAHIYRNVLDTRGNWSINISSSVVKIHEKILTLITKDFLAIFASTFAMNNVGLSG